jgi:hypothetical protein
VRAARAVGCQLATRARPPVARHGPADGAVRAPAPPDVLAQPLGQVVLPLPAVLLAPVLPHLRQRRPCQGRRRPAGEPVRRCASTGRSARCTHHGAAAGLVVVLPLAAVVVPARVNGGAPAVPLVLLPLACTAGGGCAGVRGSRTSPAGAAQLRAAAAQAAAQLLRAARPPHPGSSWPGPRRSRGCPGRAACPPATGPRTPAGWRRSSAARSRAAAPPAARPRSRTRPPCTPARAQGAGAGRWAAAAARPWRRLRALKAAAAGGCRARRWGSCKGRPPTPLPVMRLSATVPL